MKIKSSLNIFPRALKKIIPEVINSARENPALAAAVLGGFGLWTAFGGGAMVDASAHQTLRNEKALLKEETSDAALERQTKGNPNVVTVTGLTPPADHKDYFVQAKGNHVAADVLRGVGAASVACSLGFGVAAGVQRRRRRQDARMVLQANLSASARRNAAASEEKTKAVPEEKKVAVTLEEAYDALYSEVHQIGLSTGSAIAQMEAFTVQTRANADSAQRAREGVNSLEERIAKIHQEHAQIKTEMELGRQATLVGFASLRAELSLPMAANQPSVENYLPQAAPAQLIPAMA